MKISNRLLGATAVFIVIMFLGMSLQSSVAPNTHHINTISMSEKRSYGTYFIQNPSNTSDNLSNLFISWLMNIEHSNPLNGEPKFLWIFYSINFIYPWITVVGTFASTFTWNGYTNTGTVSILPYIPVASNNPAWVIVASALSGETHDLSGKIGWNSWGTVS